MRSRTSRASPGTARRGAGECGARSQRSVRGSSARARREHALSLVTIGKGAASLLGRVEEAEKRFEEAVAHFESAGEATLHRLRRRPFGPRRGAHVDGEPAGAIADERLAFEITRDAGRDRSCETLEHLSNIAVLRDRGRNLSPKAVRTFREILAVLEPAEGADSPKVLNVVLNLATALDSAGESAEALPYFERVVSGRRRIYGPLHPSLGEALVITSLRLSRAGRSADALAALAEARAIYEPLDHPELGSVDNYTGLALTDLAAFRRGRARLRARCGALREEPGRRQHLGRECAGERGLYGERAGTHRGGAGNVRARHRRYARAGRVRQPVVRPAEPPRGARTCASSAA